MARVFKYIRYAFEAFLLSLLLLIFKILPAKTASDCGGWIGRTIGPKLAASRKALRNLSNALPDLTDDEQENTIAGMWAHLGRVMAEYPHLKTLSRDRTEIVNPDHLRDILSTSENGVIFFGAHLGNWEINAPAVLMQMDTAIDLSYRAPNNPFSDALLMKMRSMGGRLEAHAKSAQGGKQMMKAMKRGGSLGILIDQKYNEGLSMPFFGIEAMTNPFFVQLAQKYKCALVPIRNERLLDGCRFKLHVYDPVEVFDKNGEPRKIEDVITEAHDLLESWIKETPEQWLWLHRRWKA